MSSFVLLNTSATKCELDKQGRRPNLVIQFLILMALERIPNTLRVIW